ncbi:MAG: hypothetical protein KA270_02870 [Saprospiraceae bacterium]|nr:hypothetical protein [Saprospiraceae bacterium]
MATNTGRRRCKNCQKDFIKKRPLDYLCSPECESQYNKKIEKAQSVRGELRAYQEKAPIRNVGKINNVSQTNRYTQSDGTKISAAALDRNIKIAKKVKIFEMVDNYGYIFCEDCNEFGLPPEPYNDMELKIIDCSHNISVDEAKKSGRAELACNVDNIRMRCRIHHRKHDKTK